VVWVGDVDQGKVKVGKNVVIIGVGSTGSETALELAKDGKQVTIVDMLNYTVLEAEWPRGLAYLLDDYGVQFFMESKLEEVTEKGVGIIDNKWKRSTIAADTVVLSLGFKPRKSTANLFKDLAADVYVIGDCQDARTIKEAVHSGFNVAVEI
jgi:2-enoate reductase